MGFYVLIDRRQSGWGSVKTILMRFSVSLEEEIRYMCN